MALTRYKVLSRNRDGMLREIETIEAHGPKQAMRRAVENGASVMEPLVAIPESNWTELMPTKRTVTTIWFCDAQEDLTETPDPDKETA